MVAKQVGRHHYDVHDDENELSRSARGGWGAAISTVLTPTIALLCGLIVRMEWWAFVMMIPGVLLGALVIAPIFVSLVRKVYLIPATTLCFGLASVAAIGAALTIGFVMSIIGGAFGFMAGWILAIKLAPRYKIYRYACCPGCGYTLVGLPKNLPCPECGRDNADLVMKF